MINHEYIYPLSIYPKEALDNTSAQNPPTKHTPTKCYMLLSTSPRHLTLPSQQIPTFPNFSSLPSDCLVHNLSGASSLLPCFIPLLLLSVQSRKGPIRGTWFVILTYVHAWLLMLIHLCECGVTFCFTDLGFRFSAD